MRQDSLDTPKPTAGKKNAAEGPLRAEKADECIPSISSDEQDGAEWFTLVDLAKLYPPGVLPKELALGLISSGALPATNLGSTARPDWRVKKEDFAVFERQSIESAFAFLSKEDE